MEVPTSFAIIGAGLIGPRHARAILEDPSTTLTAIVDPAQAGADFASSLSVPCFPSISALTGSAQKPKGAIICTPNHTHVPIALELIKAGVHVLVEKPISIDIASGITLVSTAESSHVHLLTGHHRRFNPYVTAAKQILDRNQLGRVIAVNGIWATFKPLSYFTTAPWRQKDGSGGVLLINMIHEIDILQYLLGRITRVCAEQTVSQREFEAEEGAAITFRFESGCVGTFLISDHAPSPHNFEAGTGENPLIPQTKCDFLRIFGTDGSLSVPDMSIYKYAGDQEKSWQSPLVRRDAEAIVQEDAIPFKLQLSNFVSVIAGKEQARCSGSDGLAALAVCEALRRSLKDCKPVEIAEMIREEDRRPQT